MEIEGFTVTPRKAPQNVLEEKWVKRDETYFCFKITNAGYNVNL